VAAAPDGRRSVKKKKKKAHWVGHYRLTAVGLAFVAAAANAGACWDANVPGFCILYSFSGRV
jgi:hypothetical protein